MGFARSPGRGITAGTTGGSQGFANFGAGGGQKMPHGIGGRPGMVIIACVGAVGLTVVAVFGGNSVVVVASAVMSGSA
jgi:hypothetical protein